MKKQILLCGAASMMAFAGIAASEDAMAPGQEAMAPSAVMTAPEQMQWGDAPPILEKGAMMAVVSGDPGKDGLYVIRLKMPAGYKIAAHWHPTDEHVTVVSGTMALGMGDKLDEAAMTELPVGSYALLPAHMNHFAMAKTDAIVQIHGMGPFQLTYVDPADDPSKREPGM